MRNRHLPLLIACLAALPLLTGCAPDETPEAERAAVKKTVGKANTAAADAQKRVNDENALFDAK